VNAENGIILKYVLQLMVIHKVVQPIILGAISYFTTHLSFTLLYHAPHSPGTFVLKDADLAR